MNRCRVFASCSGHSEVSTLAGLAGFAVTLGLSAAASSLMWLYAARLLYGAFAAAVVPVVLAILADQAPDENWRAQRFSWVGGASIAGLLVGPMIGGLSALMIQAKLTAGLSAPLMIATALAVLVTVFAAIFQPKGEPKHRGGKTIQHAAARPNWLFNGLLVLTGVSGGGGQLPCRPRLAGTGSIDEPRGAQLDVRGMQPGYACGPARDLLAVGAVRLDAADGGPDTHSPRGEFS